MYVAIKGTQHDGHQYIEQAVASGAQSVLCEILPQQRSAGVVYIQVEDSKEALGWVAANYFDNPSRELTLIGITGTNGKTSIASMLYELFRTSPLHPV